MEKTVLTREVDGRTEVVEWVRCADTVHIVVDGQRTVIGPEEWKQAWTDLETRGFVPTSEK